MSIDLLILIPAEPMYRPGSLVAEQAKELLKVAVPLAQDVTVQITEEIEFIATGGNLEKIICPFCQSVLDEHWWIAAMDKAYEQTRFADLSVIVPCCGKDSSLNDLCYEWPTGFACFQLIAHNPGKDIEEETFKSLEEQLACPLRKVWAHF